MGKKARKYKVLVIDDNPDHAVQIYRKAVEKDDHYDAEPKILTKPDFINEEHLKAVDIILLDFEFTNSKHNGEYALQQIKFFKGCNNEITANIILLSSMRMYSQWTVKLEALFEIGVIDFIAKSIANEFPEIFKFQLDRAIRDLDKNETIAAQQNEIGQSYKISKIDLIGESPPMKELLNTIEKIAPTDSSVLITGESGTGKELAARLIHNKSPRHNGPFVPVNCAAIPLTLAESALFGHEKGAFTGANQRKLGHFEKAHMGTIFLDEIADMEPILQVKLLRVIQEKTFERLGGSKPVHVNVRIIAATNRDLKIAVDEGQLREDLYYRLSVIQLPLAPLRERIEDITPLSFYFLDKARRKEPALADLKGISDGAIDKLKKHHWQGNVRDLESTLSRSFIFAKDAMVSADDISLDNTFSTAEQIPVPEKKGTSFNATPVVEELIKDRDLTNLEFIKTYGQNEFEALQKNPKGIIWDKYLALRNFKMVDNSDFTKNQKAGIAYEINRALINCGEKASKKMIAIAMGISYGYLRQIWKK